MADEQSALDLPSPTPVTPIDMKELIGVVAKRHGVMLKKDDPAFILVTLLEEVSKRHLGHLTGELENALDAISASTVEQQEASKAVAERIVNEGGAFIARRIQTAGEAMAPAITDAVIAGLAPTFTALNTATSDARRAKWAAVVAAGVAIVAMVGCAGLYFGGLTA